MLVPGVVLQGRYRVVRALGAGGFSTVYLAEDTRLAGRLVAVKENQDVLPAAVRAFTQEAELLARLQHPNLPRVTDHFSEPSGYQYLVMDYVEGENLDDLVERQGRMDEAAALAVLREVMDAVAYLHRQQPPIIHRDIKPSNLIRRHLDGKVILVDFGIAKQQIAGGGTLTGTRAATPGYAPPEQYFGRTDARSDVYSLGATLYFFLTGVVPPEAPARASGYESLASPRKINSKISTGIEAAILRAMDLDASLRFADVPTLAGSLFGGSLTDTQLVNPSLPAERARHKWPLAIGLGLVVLALLMGVLIAQQSRPASQLEEGRAIVLPRAETIVVHVPSVEPGGTATETPENPDAAPTAAVSVSVPRTTAALSPTTTLAPTIASSTPTDMPLPTSTSVPSPTDPPLPTSSPVPPAPTVALVERPFPISLADVANASTENGYETPPMGRVELGGVLFDLPGGRNSVTTQAESLPDNPVSVMIPLQIDKPQQVQLLLTGGNLFAQYASSSLGLVRLHFASGAVQEEQLVAGYNMREWKLLDQATVATTTASNTREVWRTNSRYGGIGVIDMLTVAVAPENQTSALAAVELVDTSFQGTGSLDPAINWLGLTVIGLEPVGRTGSTPEVGAAPARCDPGDTFFNAWNALQAQLGCPLAPAQSETFTFQAFANGFMIWAKSTDEITVLPANGPWLRTPNNWRANDDPISCQEARAAGSPVMGFGREWCSNASIRTALGAATGPEEPDDNGAVQRFQNGTIVRGSAGQTFVLYDDQTWTQP